MAVGKQHHASQTSSAADQAYLRILEQLGTDELPPGSWLRESSLAEALGMSRTPVREALSRLGSEGLVRLERHRGAQVVGWDRDQVIEIYGLRAVVEGYVAALAAQKIDAKRLVALDENLAAYTELLANENTPVAEAATLNNEFHSQILEAAGSDNLTLLTNGMFGLPLVRRTFLKYSREDLHRSVQHHQELVEALRARDSESAELIMKVHIRTAQRTALARESSLYEAPSEADRATR